MKCKKGFEIEVFKSPAGYYLGTKDQDGFPNCRISREYAATKEEAERLPLNRQIGSIENEWCNNGEGCFNV